MHPDPHRVASRYLTARLPSKLTAWHGGRKLEGGRFTLDHVGTGEGLFVNGPGIYFTTNLAHARDYATHYGRNDPWVYEVTLDTSGFVNLLYTGSLAPNQILLRDLAAKHGRGLGAPMRNLMRAMSAADLRRLLIDNGITGNYERIGPGTYEIAVFDPRVIHLVGAVPPAEVNLPPATEDDLMTVGRDFLRSVKPDIRWHQYTLPERLYRDAEAVLQDVFFGRKGRSDVHSKRDVLEALDTMAQWPHDPALLKRVRTLLLD